MLAWIRRHLPRVPPALMVAVLGVGVLLELVAVANEVPGDTITEGVTRAVEGVLGALAVSTFLAWALIHFVRRLRWRRDDDEPR